MPTVPAAASLSGQTGEAARFRFPIAHSTFLSFPSLMHIPRWFIWLLLYAAATFSWIVFFEHGPAPEKFRQGARREWDRVWNASSAWLDKLRTP